MEIPAFISNYEQVSSSEGSRDLQLVAGNIAYGFISPKHSDKRIWLFGDINVSNLKVDRQTDRKHAANLANELADEIKEGHIDPIFVEINTKWDDYDMVDRISMELIDGNHRVLAARMLGVKTLKGYVIMPIGWKPKKDIKEEVGGFVKIFRALPLSSSIIRNGDYITLSKKFASDHAVTSAIYNDEPFQVAMTIVPRDHIENALNPGEYIYIGPNKKVKPLLVADIEGEVKRASSLKEEIKTEKGYNWEFNSENGIKLWNLFKDMGHNELFFDPNGAVSDTNAKGAWIPSSYRAGKLLLAMPQDRKIISYSKLTDPRIAAALSTSAESLPELNDYTLELKDLKGDETNSLGKLKDLLTRLKTVEFKAEKYRNRAFSNDDTIEYEDFKLKVLEDLDELTWYHATSMDHLKSIMNTGLKTSRSAKDMNTGWSQFNMEMQDAIYLTSDEEYVVSIAESLLVKKGSPGVILEVSGKALQDKSKFVIDEDELRSHLQGMESQIDYGKLVSGIPHYLSSVISDLNSVGYKENIPAVYLKPVAVVDYKNEEENEAEVYDWDEWNKKLKENYNLVLEYYDNDDDESCVDKIDVPFKMWPMENVGFYEVFPWEEEYKKGKMAHINVNDPNLFATQDHVCQHIVEAYMQNKNIKKLKPPIVNKFEDGPMLIQDGHHRLSATKFSGEKTLDVYLILRGTTEDVLNEERIKKDKYGADLFQMGSSLPDHLYNMKDGKPTRDPGIGGRKKSLKEMYFAEAAKGAGDLPEGSKIYIAPNMMNGFTVVMEDAKGGTIGEIDLKPGNKKCLGAYIIAYSEAKSGFGPLLYDIALEHAGKLGVTPDRESVSEDASNVWEYYYTKRGDVQKKPVNPETCSTDASKSKGSVSFNISNNDDTEIQRPWLNFVYYKDKTIIPELEKSNVIVYQKTFGLRETRLFLDEIYED